VDDQYPQLFLSNIILLNKRKGMREIEGVGDSTEDSLISQLILFWLAKTEVAIPSIIFV
jgi:hypothetical protein